MSQRKLRVVEWFGGIGAATQALKQMGQDHEVIDYVELDKYAVKSYNAINGTDFKPTDINDVDVNKYGEIDLLIAGWPCQDYSFAGKRLGTFGGDRSSLILVTIDKLHKMEIKPRHILLENVKGLLTKQDELNQIKEWFKELGYEWSQALLNSKNFHNAQSRERVFMLLTRKDLPRVEIKELESIRQEPQNMSSILDYNAPTHTHTLTKTSGIEYFVNELSNYNGKMIRLDIDKLNNQNELEINKVAQLGEITGGEFIEHSFNQKKNFLGIDGVSKTLRAGDCDNESKVIFKRIPFVSDKDFNGTTGLTPTLVANSPDFKNKILYNNNNIVHYRKLTTLETWKLMGFSQQAHDKVKASGISDSQMNKQAGNSIVVNCLKAIFDVLLEFIEVNYES